MLDIFLFVLTSPNADLPISPLTSQERLMAVSNTDGFTPNHLLQPVHEATVLDDEDLELSDKDLELIAGGSVVASSYTSDVFADRKKIIDFRNDVLRFVRRNDHPGLIRRIKTRFQQSGVFISDQAAGRLSDNLRHVTPIVIKGERAGFIINLRNGNLCYLDTPGCSVDWIS